MTSKRAAVTIQRYNELVDLGEEFDRFKRPSARRGPIRFSNDRVETEINTACHCHPEYEWVGVGSLEEFGEWLDKLA